VTNHNRIFSDVIRPRSGDDPGGFVQVERDARAMVEADPAHRQYLERVLVFLYHHVLKNKGECRSADNIEIGLEQAPFVFF